MAIKKYAVYGLYNVLRYCGYFKYLNKKSDFINIVYFHRVNDDVNDDLTISTEMFDRMMNLLSRKYDVISINQIVEAIKRENIINRRAIAITFDDGYLDNYTHAAPILTKYGLTACFFITSGYISSNRVFPWNEKSGSDCKLMSWDQVRSLSENGFEIGAHTVDHVNLGTESVESARHQIIICKKDIEDKIGLEVKYFAYPFGGTKNIRNETRSLVKKAGFDCCCSGYGGKVTVESDLYNLHRIPTYPNCIEMSMELDNFMTYYNGKMKINFPILERLA